MQRGRNGDRIGLMLDLDKGTLTIFRNGIKLGIMANELDNKYRWAVVLTNKSEVSIKTITIEHALQETQYRETIELMRPYRSFVRKYFKWSSS